MDYLNDVPMSHPDLGDLYDEAPLWSAPFGLFLLDQIPMQIKGMVLDVGAGTGFLTVELAQRLGADATIIAVDPWSAAVNRLRRKVGYLDLKNVQILEQDAAELPLADGAVALVASNLGINNFANVDAVMSTLFRVLAPAGKLLLSTNLVGTFHEFYDVFRTTLIDLQLTNGLDRLVTHLNKRAACEPMQQTLLSHGFTNVHFVHGQFRSRFANGACLLRHYFMRLGFLPAWKEIVPHEAREKTFARLEQKLDSRAQTLGELTLTVPMAIVSAEKPALA